MLTSVTFCSPTFCTSNIRPIAAHLGGELLLREAGVQTVVAQVLTETLQDFGSGAGRQGGQILIISKDTYSPWTQRFTNFTFYATLFRSRLTSASH
jgi:hypothetical protein